MRNLLDETGYNRLVKARHGYVLYNGNDIVVGRSIEHYGEYFESEVDLFRHIVNPGDIAIDAGANIGTHALALARMTGPSGCVIAFEPQRLVCQILCANAAINSLEQMECVQGGLSDTSGVLEVGDLSLAQPNNFGGLALGAIAGNLSIPLIRLDDYFKYGRLRFIKIDVEGMEAQVLRGARATIGKFRPILYVENDRIEKSEELLTLIDELGYRTFWHLPLFHNPGNFFGATDALHQQGYVDQGNRFAGIGFAVNLLCIPNETTPEVAGLHAVLDAREHPFKKHCNARFRAAP